MSDKLVQAQKCTAIVFKYPNQFEYTAVFASIRI